MDYRSKECCPRTRRSRTCSMRSAPPHVAWEELHLELVELLLLLRRQHARDLGVVLIDLLPDLRPYAVHDLLHARRMRFQNLLHLLVLLRREMELVVELVQDALGHPSTGARRTMQQPDAIADDAD